MKQVKWIDERGKIHLSLIRETDSDDMAKFGIPQDPPDISDILEMAKIELHNSLVECGILTYNDIIKYQNSVSAIVKRVISNKIVSRYRERDTNSKQEA